MPMKPKRPCRFLGCKAFSDGPYCEVHRIQVSRDADRRRATAHERGYDAEWARARARFLSEHPLCSECARQGQVVPATVVDHIKPHQGDRALFWDQGNWQPLCKYHHDVKTATEDGGFGRAPSKREEM